MVVGGGFAGHAAALQLGRARRRVLLVDAGRPRNRFAGSSHGFLGLDGASPQRIRRTFLGQLEAYQTVSHRAGEVIGASTVDTGFRMELGDGEPVLARAVILAGGVRDHLPDLPGLKERWGASVLHCPYCHGYELNEAPVGVLGDGPMAFHQSMIVRDWGPTTLFTQGALQLTAEQRTALKHRDIAIESTPVTELLGDGAELHGAKLTDGRLCQISGLYIAAKTQVVGGLAGDLGCDFEEGPTGKFIAVDDRQLTSVAGVFAAGDAAAPMANATLSAAAGVRAGTSAHAMLVFDRNGAA